MDTHSLALARATWGRSLADANLYYGLWCEAVGNIGEAELHLRRAATSPHGSPGLDLMLTIDSSRVTERHAAPHTTCVMPLAGSVVVAC